MYENELDEEIGVKAYTKIDQNPDFAALIVYATNGEHAADVLEAHMKGLGGQFRTAVPAKNNFINIFNEMAGDPPDCDFEGMKSIMLTNQALDGLFEQGPQVH